MNTLEFLRTILPAEGVKFLAFPLPKGGMAHKSYTDLNVMAAAAQQFSEQGKTIYHACAGHVEVIRKTAKNGFSYETRGGNENVSHMKSLWEDIDVAKENVPSYPTAAEAVAAVSNVCKVVGIPSPMIVSSGKGLHLYWVFDSTVTKQEWLEIATLKNSALAIAGLRIDTHRSADAASILRPVGTVGSGGKIVRVLRESKPLGYGELRSKFIHFLAANGASTRVPKVDSVFGALENTLAGAAIEYPPADANLVADRCAQVDYMRSNRGDIGYESWFKCLGVIKHAIDGPNVVHEWSKGAESYNREETDFKIESWSTGPTTCDSFKRSFPERCANCTRSVKSPIQLGQVETKASVSEEDPLPYGPRGYRWNGRNLVREVPGDDGIVESVPFSRTLFYPISRIRREDGIWYLRVKMSVSSHYWREFDLPQSLIPDPRGLAKFLGQYEIFTIGVKHVTEYMVDYLHSLRDMNHQTLEYDRFGWDGGRFIVGTTAFLPNGELEPVLVTENVDNANRKFDGTPVGSLETWVELIDKAYNRPGGEPFQFAIAAAFASPLVEMANLSNYSGIPIAITGDGGIGKSSICKAAATIYCHPDHALQDATASGGSTLQGLLGLASLYNSVPMLMDEMTERDVTDIISLLYSLSNGRGKQRMSSNGKFADTVKPFKGIKFITSNNNITDVIHTGEKQSVSDAVEARCFEIALTRAVVDPIFADTDMKSLLEHELFNHHGVAAQVYLPYVATNHEAVVARLLKARTALGKNAQADSRERYYIDTIAFAAVAAQIASKLGLIKWDITNMTKWAVGHLKELRRNFVERTALADDHVSLFLSWLHGNTIVTNYYPQTGAGRVKESEMEGLMEPLRGPARARVALKDRRMMVRSDAITAWCAEYNVPRATFKSLLMKGGYLLREERQYIGKGTTQHTGQAMTFEMNYDLVSGSIHVLTGVEPKGKVVTLRPEMSQEVSHPTDEAAAVAV